MKPISLEIQAFGPYVEKQTIDFQKLTKKGIFLVRGITGSGKTTIFDAMMFALYGGGSGTSDHEKRGRNDIAEWRCMQADDSLETLVSFTFMLRDKTYYFTRRYVKARTNYSEKCDAGIIVDGNRIPFFENPKKSDLNEKAEELIGLSKDQFRQVVLLPQGQFETFLLSSSGEKQEILRKIFKTEKWDAYAKDYFEKADAAKKALEDNKTAIDNSLAEEGVESIEALGELILSLGKEDVDIEKNHADFNGNEKQEALNRDIALSEQFSELHKLERKEKELNEEKPKVDEAKKLYDRAEKAEKVRADIDEFERAGRETAARLVELDRAKKTLPLAQEKEKTAKAEKEAHEKDTSAEGWKKTIGTYDAKRDFYKNLDDLKQAYDKADKACQEAERLEKTAVSEWDEAVKQAVSAKNLFDAAEKTEREYRNQYYAGIYGEIAGTLVEGEKCPICGSTTHPAPAVKAPGAVEKTDLEEKEEATKKARKKWDEAEDKRKEKEQNKTTASEKVKTASREKDKAESALQTAQANLIAGIASTAELEAAVKSLQNKIDAFDRKTTLLQNAYNAAAREATAAGTTLTKAEDEWKNAVSLEKQAKETLERKLAENGYADYESAKQDLMSAKERTEMHERIVNYESSCRDNAEALKERQKLLEGKAEPDKTGFNDRQREITDENRRFSARHAEIQKEVKRLSDKEKALSEKNREFRQNIGQVSEDWAFAKALRGDTGIGIERFVQAIMFDQVIHEANQMLTHVHGGRYSLYRTDESAAGNKKGLDLKVHDNRCADKEGRGVRLLSGGEKFLISLALSIGMSMVAQNSGALINTLLLDEGFGTLDDSSIHDALDVLDSVRKNNGAIGIISHIKLLEENIPTQIEAVKTDKGSHIKVI